VQLFALGINHHTAPLAVRELVAFDPASLSQALHNLLRGHSVQEAALLSTCNRTELYCTTEHPQAAADWLATFHALPPEKIQPYLYQHPQQSAALLPGWIRWSSGEPQILGQMKDAVRMAEEAGTLGTLHKLFQRAFAVAKEVRSTTAIGANTVSMAAAGVHLAERIFDKIADAAHSVHRRRRNDRTLRHALCCAAAEGTGHRQPHARTRARAGRAFRRLGDPAR
jgi:glutamyl-tRNA reductase